MNAKQYLMEIEILAEKIEQKKQRAKEYRILALSNGVLDYSKERVQTSNLGGQIESNVIRYVELEKEIEDSVYVLQQKKDKITCEIHNLEDVNHIKLLYKKYVEGKDLRKIAKEMKYSYQHVREMHREALKEFEKINFPTQSYKEV